MVLCIASIFKFNLVTMTTAAGDEFNNPICELKKNVNQTLIYGLVGF